MSSFFDDTICAIATPAGSGAIAVIRLSGKKAIQIIDSVYTSPKKGKQLVAQPANTIHFGSVMHQGQLIDEVLISLFKAPHSYTGEDVLELQAHGGPVVLQLLLARCLQAGAGIVADSDPAREYQESLDKLGALTRAVRIAEEGSRITPSAGR